MEKIEVFGARENNLKNFDVDFPRDKLIVITGVSGSGKSSLVFDTILAESQRRFFYTLSNYTRQFLNIQDRPKVRKINGVSPAIFLAQNETAPSSRATVASLTDIGELLGVLFARHGTKLCPDHGLETTGSSLKSIVSEVQRKFKNKYMLVSAPIITDKKGKYSKELKKLMDDGFQRFFIDGEMITTEDEVPSLSGAHKHTIKLVVDLVKADQASTKRLQRAIEVALKHGGEHVEITLKTKEDYDFKNSATYSLQNGCPDCGFSWPKLDSRYFSSNSQGRCEECNGYGYFDTSEEGTPIKQDLAFQMRYWEDCEFCEGTGLLEDLEHVQIEETNIHELYQYSLSELHGVVKKLKSPTKNPAFLRIQTEILTKITQLTDMGLGYLQLFRRIKTISGGELQRLRLASLLNANLSGIMYVFDEPSQGLAPSEIETIAKILLKLRDRGNSLFVVDHDEIMMEYADIIYDMGPGGGPEGGRLLSQFAPKDAKLHSKTSHSAMALFEYQNSKKSPKPKSSTIKKNDDFLVLHKPELNNLKIKSVKFRKKSINIVSGVSGAGKSSLTKGVLHYALTQVTDKKRKGPVESEFFESIENSNEIEHVYLVNRKPLAKSSVSTPATYLDIYSDIRKLMAKVPTAQVLGLTIKDFSFHSKGGRCEVCGGRGYESVTMRFLPDTKTVCYHCQGKRFDQAVLSVQYNGLNISEILNLSIGEAIKVFENHKKIASKLQNAINLGLGYLKLGQPTSTFSGGEAQRMKLVPIVSKKKPAWIILDEPTMGLHHQNILQLTTALHELVSRGFTFVIIDNAPTLIERSHWQIELGPGSAENGGKIMFERSIKTKH